MALYIEGQFQDPAPPGQINLGLPRVQEGWEWLHIGPALIEEDASPSDLTYQLMVQGTDLVPKSDKVKARLIELGYKVFTSHPRYR